MNKRKHLFFLILGDLIIVLLQGFFFGVGIRASAGVFNVVMLSLIPVICWLIAARILRLYTGIQTLSSTNELSGPFKTLLQVCKAQRIPLLILVSVVQSLCAVSWQGFWWKFILKADFWLSPRYFAFYTIYGLSWLFFYRLLWSGFMLFQLTARRHLSLQILRGALLIAFIGFQLPALILTIRYQGQKYTMQTAAELPYKTAIVPGAGVFANGRVSIVLQDRVNTAAELFQMGYLSQILLSGDNADRSHNEVDAMFSVAEEAGVPLSALLRDDDGTSTYRTCQNARNVFALDQAVIVTQNFHTTRTLYLCEKAGIKAVSLSADRSVYNISSWLLWHVNDWIKLSLTYFSHL